MKDTGRRDLAHVIALVSQCPDLFKAIWLPLLAHWRSSFC